MATTVRAVDMNTMKTEEVALDEAIFGVAVRPHLLHDVVKMQLAGRRQGTASTRTRSDVRGGGKKPWKQKGTGRARAGTRRSPLWRGGGTVFGPRPRHYGYLVPKQVRSEALRGALSAKAQAGKLVIVDGLSLARPSTKDFRGLLARLGIVGTVLVVTEHVRRDDAVPRSCRNLPGVTLLAAQGVNVYDVMKHETLVMTRSALGLVEEAWKP